MKSTTGSRGTLHILGAMRLLGRYIFIEICKRDRECGNIWVAAAFIISCNPSSSERRQTQSQPSQMLCAFGKRQGGRVDGRRDRVPPEETPEDCC